MPTITITCPHCSYSKAVNSEKIPASIKKINCPKCKKAFPFAQPSPPKQPGSRTNISTSHKNDKPFEVSTHQSDQFKYCSTCGQKINYKAEICPKCGVRVAPPPNSINKVTLLLITFFLGCFGGHKFYQKKYLLGILYLLFSWIYVPALIAFVEFFIYAFTSEEKLQRRYPEGSSNAVIVAILLPFIGIAMMGILAAIAIPQFAAYRERAFQHTATNELMTCQAEVEKYISTNETYPTAADDFYCKVSEDIALFYLVLGAEEYQLVSYHDRGKKAFLFSSQDKLVKENTLEEIKKQLEESFGPSILTPEFHFIR